MYPDWPIDVTQECIAPSSYEMKKYLTLPYTWALIPNLRTMTLILNELRKPGALAPSMGFASMIPKTIRNAIEIEKWLVERYIWVDSLCVVQDDEVAFNRSPKNMHMIFDNSLLCLVTMAG
jgi:hypothetical protein